MRPQIGAGRKKGRKRVSFSPAMVLSYSVARNRRCTKKSLHWSLKGRQRAKRTLKLPCSSTSTITTLVIIWNRTDQRLSNYSRAVITFKVPFRLISLLSDIRKLRVGWSQDQNHLSLTAKYLTSQIYLTGAVRNKNWLKDRHQFLRCDNCNGHLLWTPKLAKW